MASYNVAPQNDPLRNIGETQSPTDGNRRLSLNPQAMAIYTRVFGGNVYDQATTLNNFGVASYLSGDVLLSLQFHERAYLLRGIGEIALDNLRMAVSEPNRNVVEVHKQVLALHKKLYGETHEVVADTLLNLGDAYMEGENIAEVINAYTESLEIRQNHSNNPLAVVDTLCKLGIAHLRNEDLDKQISCYTEMLEVLNALPGQNVGRIADIEHVLGNLLSKKNDTQGAIQYYVASIHHVRSLPEYNKNRLGFILSTLGSCYVKTFQLDKAFETFTSWLEMLRSSSEVSRPFQLYSALTKLANVHLVQKEFAKAIPFYSEALETARCLSTDERVAVLMCLTKCYGAKGDLKGVIKACSEILSICRDRPFDPNSAGHFAFAHQALGMTFRSNNDIAKAVLHLEQALPFYRERRGKFAVFLVDILMELGFACSENREFSKAIAFFLEFFDVSKDLPENLNAKQRVLSMLGGCYEIEGRLEDAVRSFEQSIEMESRIPDISSVVKTMNRYGLGITYDKQGNEDKALDIYMRALEELPEGFTSLQCDILRSMAIVYIKQKETDKAIQACLRSLEGRKRISECSPRVAETYEILAYVYDLNGDIDGTIATYQAAIEMRQKLSLVTDALATSYNNIGVQYFYKKDGLEDAIAFLLKSKETLQECSSNDLDLKAITTFNLGSSFYLKGDLKNSLEFLRIGAEISRQTPNNSVKSEAIITALNDIEAIIGLQNDDEIKIVIQIQMVALYKIIHGEKLPIIGLFLNKLSETYREEGRFLEAIKTLEESAAIFAESWGEGHPLFIRTQEKLNEKKKTC